MGWRGTEDELAEPNLRPALGPVGPGGSLFAWWIATGIASFFAGLIGVVFSTAFEWDESYTPPSCFELVDELGAGWALLAIFAGPLLAVITLMAAATKAATAASAGAAVAFTSRLVVAGLAVIAAAPIVAYALIDAGYRAGVRGEYEIADRAACVDQLLPRAGSWSILTAIVIGCVALGRAMVSHR